MATVDIPNVGSPPDDPLLLLPGRLYLPDSNVHPPPWHCITGTQSTHWSDAESLHGLNQPFIDLSAAGFLCLGHYVRLVNNPLPGQTTTGKYPQQSNDLKIGIRAMRSNPFGLGYSVTGFVGGLGGSSSAYTDLYCAIDGTEGSDKYDAAICMSPPTDLSDREADVPGAIITICVNYGGTTNLPTLFLSSPPGLPNLASASPILLYNGDDETIPVSMKTRMDTAMSGVSQYESILNTESLGQLHSFNMWPFIGTEAINWMSLQAVNWAIVDPTPVVTYSPPMWNISIVTNSGTKVFKYNKTGSDAYSLSNAIYEALHTTGLSGVSSVTATII